MKLEKRKPSEDMLTIELYTGTHAIHPVDQAPIDYPPDGCIYTPKKLNKLGDWLRRRVPAPIFRELYQKYRNGFRITHHRPKVDLIHACRRLINTESRWVADFENAGSFLGYPIKGWDSPSYKRIIERRLSQPNLKKLIAWSNAGKKACLIRLILLASKRNLR